jgi:hypothetical protein
MFEDNLDLMPLAVISVEVEMRYCEGLMRNETAM